MHTYVLVQLCQCLLLKCILEQEEAEEGLAFVKHMDDEAKACKLALNLLFLSFLLCPLKPV